MRISTAAILTLCACTTLASCTQAGAPMTGISGAAHELGAASALRHTAQPPSDVRLTEVNWPQQGLNAAHTGYNAAEKSLGIGNVGTLALRWSFPTGAQITAPILIAGGVAYINSSDGYLYAVDAATGVQIWKTQTYEGYTSNNPVIAGELVVVPCLVDGNNQQNGVCALKRSNGSLAWEYYLDCNCLPPAGVTASLVVSGKTLLVPFYGSNLGGPYLIALDVKTGGYLWEYTYPGGNSGGPSSAAPAIAGTTVYIGQGYTNSVCSLQLSNGALNWCAPTGDFGNSVAVSKGVVYANTDSHGVFAFNASTGSQLWQYTPNAGNSSGQDDPPAIAGKTVYVAGVGFSGNLYALKASSGALIYHTSTGSGGAQITLSSPSVANGVAYVECQSGVCAFNAETGDALYSSGASGSQQSSPAVVDGVLYDTCGPNTACAYGLPPSK
jgi:outer membrane protein assembly factor BamB